MSDWQNNIYLKELMHESFNKQYACKIDDKTGERQGDENVRANGKQEPRG